MSITWSSFHAIKRVHMFSKIVITIAVIMLCMWVLSNRAVKKPQLREIPDPAVEKRRKLMRHASVAFMLIMVIAAGVMIYLELGSRGS